MSKKKKPPPQSPPKKSRTKLIQDHFRGYPVFCLRHLTDKRYNLESCQKNQATQLIKKLFTLSQKSWKSIDSLGKHKGGYEKVSFDMIKGRVPQFLTEDVNLLAFRFDGLKPFVGFRNNDVFHILWIDHDFTLYDHG
jgi:hypothetical protein